MRVLSYNLRHHRAAGEIESLVAAHAVDVMCLQEAYVSELPRHAAGLERAATTSTGLLGLAVYVDASRYAVVASRAFRLKRGIHDVAFLPGTERLLAVRLVDRRTGERTTVASFHAAPLTATNLLRRHQVAAAHMLLDDFGAGEPVLMVGDFNYPLFRAGLQRHAARDGYTVTRSDRPTYRHVGPLSTHFDLLSSRDVGIDSVRTLPAGASDHRPILVTVAPGAVDARTESAARRRRYGLEHLVTDVAPTRRRLGLSQIRGAKPFGPLICDNPG
jgi:endonuclease/exonuclease/phosphatase family metal-dependent hydrolase